MTRLAALVLLVPLAASAQSVEGRYAPRPLEDGHLYLGSAPGVNVGGSALPRALYMDVLQAGYVFPSGLDVSMALSGTNWFPDEGDYSVSIFRAAVGWRPFLSDPLPMVQPYVLAGSGFGGEGMWSCSPDVSCDPSEEICRDVCGRSSFRMSLFAGGGVDFTTRLFDVGNQQVMAYFGVQGRYELLLSRYQMAVFTFPVGLKLQ